MSHQVDTFNSIQPMIHVESSIVAQFVVAVAIGIKFV